jgi:ribosome-dependent ATPase
MPFRGETISQYLQGVHGRFLQDPGAGLATGASRGSASFQERYMYNPTFQSIYSIVPSVPALLLILIPAILMAVSIVREKELGSIINFYVTPTGRLEYLLGKQLPYVAIGMINFFILALLAQIVFGVAIKGNFLVLTLCTFLYLLVTTAIGMVTATITKTQVATVFITAILTIQPTVQFAGLLQPVSTLEGSARRIGSIWPTTYYMHASLGTYTKGLASHLVIRDLIVLAISYPILLVLSTLGLKKQDK